MSTTLEPAGNAPATLPALLARGRVRGTVAMFGPAFVAAVAYVDPGNFATNISAGAGFGYQLTWVVVLASIMAMPVQYCSAKVGIVTGKSLPEVCAERYGRRTRWALWAQAELVAMATDLAEFAGAALGLHLLFGIPMVVAGLITAGTAFAVLALQVGGYRPFERAIAALLLVIMGAFAYELWGTGPDLIGGFQGLLPSLPGGDGTFLTVGIIGATVMPHVVYLHSALTCNRVRCDNDAERRQALRFERWDVIAALGLAGIVNLTMLLVAAKLFHGTGQAAPRTLEAAHLDLGRVVGGTAALIFAIALLASGISSSAVGTFAGQVVMAGFVNLTISLVLRRLITIVPALAVLVAGLDITDVLNVSQVVLSFGIPFALVPLYGITRDPNVMHSFTNTRALRMAMAIITVVITALNALLLYDVFLG